MRFSYLKNFFTNLFIYGTSEHIYKFHLSPYI